ncbi:Presenilin-like membrane protease, A22 family [Halogranum amylolyticum]|uniref:Presenilin-like membrane protease, A22 family n=1 Tax=Halogranum amylolyticum TaxID=660520 RepID=A0A1H8P8Q1_9EURY|nr:presenilin family intramembrane aspartyl protease PSH [Halogranum amylolyticum]SEO38124.1 Presenilin-like membrane protease, A22 family [Halogranum amylolyticum]
MNSRAYWGAALAALIFLLVQLGALALVPTFDAAGYQTIEDPSDPTNSLLYIGAILVMTALMLAAFKYNLDQVVRGIIVLTSGMLAWYVFSVVAPPIVAVGLAALVSLALLVYPEWYVIDTAGVLMGAGAAGLFGISFGLLPAVVLLALLAVYDAISVYGTEHMLDLAEGVMDLNIPVVLVIPLTLSYSLLDDRVAETTGSDSDTATDGSGKDASTESKDEAVETSSTETATDESRGEAVSPDAVDRDAFFIGLGDAVMPTVMVASAAFFLDAGNLGLAVLPALNLAALLAMVGTFLGLGVLLWLVMKGRAHAGLPLLNGGAIGGYLLGAVLSGVSLIEALGLGPYL